MESIRDIIHKCKQIYSPGLYYISAFYKSHNNKDHNYPKPVNIVTSRIQQFLHEDQVKGMVAIEVEGHDGLIYYNGTYADICDVNGNIIHIVTNGEIENNDLTNIRDWLYKD